MKQLMPKNWTYGRWGIGCKVKDAPDGMHFWHMGEKPWFDYCFNRFCGKQIYVPGRTVKNGRRINYISD